MQFLGTTLHYLAIKKSNKKCDFLFLQLSASTIWALFAVDMKYALEDHVHSRECKSSTYLNCHFRVKWLYKTYVAHVPPYKGQVPEYPA